MKAKAHHTDTVILMYMTSADKMVGYTVSKKMANAVLKNKIKRRLRAAFRAQEHSLCDGLYLLVAKQSAASAPYAKLSSDVKRSLSVFNVAKK